MRLRYFNSWLAQWPSIHPLSAASALIAFALVVHSTAHAQATDASDSGTGLEEVLVTATRHVQSAQSVPISLTAVSGDLLERSGVTSAIQLPQVVPSMYVLGAISAGSPRYSIRGISNFDAFPQALSAVATYIDDVFQASQFGLTTALFDLQRVEVLRGPQGTTFGKNTTGGAVAYFSQIPTNELEGYATARWAEGYRPERFLESALNVPLVDQTLAMRISLHVDDKGNYIRDLTGGERRGDGDSQAGRVQLRWTPSEDTMLNFTGFASRLRNDAALARAEVLPGNAFFLPPVPLDIDHVTLTPLDGLRDDFDNKGATLRLEQKIGTFNLTAISHFRHTTYNKRLDVDGLALDVFYYDSRSTAEQYGQEIRITSDPAKTISGLAGAYFEKDKVEDLSAIGATRPDAYFGNYNNHAEQLTRTTSYAAFGNLTFKVNEQISVIGGVRKSYEKRAHHGTTMYFQLSSFDWTQDNLVFEGAPPITPDQILDFRLQQVARPLSWDGTIDYQVTPAVLLFARVADGFRSGGFNQSAPLFPPIAAFSLPMGVPPLYRGETVRSYELGLKSDLLERRLRLNAGVFHYDYRDQQVTTFPNAQPTTANAGSSEVDGGEIEIQASPIERLELRASIGYADARFTKYVTEVADYSGNRLVQAPEWTANASITWSTPMTDRLDFVANTNWAYRSAVFFFPDNAPEFRASPMTTGNIRLGAQSSAGKGISIAGFVNNITDERALDGGASFGPNFYAKYFGYGRLYGADVSYRW